MQAYDAKTFDQWNHTAALNCYLHNLLVTVNTLGSKRKPHYLTPDSFHPMKRGKVQGLKLTKANFHVLKIIGDSMVS